MILIMSLGQSLSRSLSQSQSVSQSPGQSRSQILSQSLSPAWSLSLSDCCHGLAGRHSGIALPASGQRHVLGAVAFRRLAAP